MRDMRTNGQSSERRDDQDPAKFPARRRQSILALEVTAIGKKVPFPEERQCSAMAEPSRLVTGALQPKPAVRLPPYRDIHGTQSWTTAKRRHRPSGGARRR